MVLEDVTREVHLATLALFFGVGFLRATLLYLINLLLHLLMYLLPSSKILALMSFSVMACFLAGFFLIILLYLTILLLYFLTIDLLMMVFLWVFLTQVLTVALLMILVMFLFLANLLTSLNLSLTRAIFVLSAEVLYL